MVASGHVCHQIDERPVGHYTPRDPGVIRSIDVAPALVGVSLNIVLPTFACLNLMDLYLGWPEAGQGVQGPGRNIQTVAFEYDYDFGIKDCSEGTFDRSPALTSAPMALEAKHFPGKDRDHLLDPLPIPVLGSRHDLICAPWATVPVSDSICSEMIRGRWICRRVHERVGRTDEVCSI
jgi:hypothetical protein